MSDVLGIPPNKEPIDKPIWVPAGTLSEFAEYIGVCAIKNARDPNGLKIMVRPLLGDLPEIARECLRRALGATYLIEMGEPDPDLGPNTVILKGF